MNLDRILIWRASLEPPLEYSVKIHTLVNVNHCGMSLSEYSKSKICNLKFYTKFSGLLWHFMSTNSWLLHRQHWNQEG